MLRRLERDGEIGGGEHTRKLVERMERHRHDPPLERADLFAELLQLARLEGSHTHTCIAQEINRLQQLEDALVRSRRAPEQDHPIVVTQAEAGAELGPVEPRRVEH